MHSTKRSPLRYSLSLRFFLSVNLFQNKVHALLTNSIKKMFFISLNAKTDFILNLVRFSLLTFLAEKLCILNTLSLAPRDRVIKIVTE